ncbi:MAG: hypothetical protein QG599_275 [Pseudomonadota bacterium]|nr:hypothetical protein [Pseudomonadota bacterium]
MQLRTGETLSFTDIQADDESVDVCTYRCVNHGLLFHDSLLASSRLPKGTAWFSPLKFPTGGELYADEATACSPRSHALSASVTSRPTGGRFLRTEIILG